MRSLLSRRRFLSAATMTALLPTGLSGCDVGHHKREDDPRGNTRFRDLDDRSIELAHPAERIVTLVVPDAAMAIAAHGGPQRLAAIHPRARDMFERGFIGKLFPDVLELPTNVVIGSDFTPNVEGIARLDPDLIVQWGELGDELIAPLENVGLTVARYRPLPHGAEPTLAAMLVMFGAMAGDTARAARLNAERRALKSRIANRLAAVREQDRASALILTITGDTLHASGGGAAGVYSYLLYESGGRNVAETLPDYSVVGREQIVAWNPDVIFLFNVGNIEPSMVLQDPILGSCTAAKNRRIYVLPTGSHYWGSIGPEDGLAQAWMAELLYPLQLKPMLRAELRSAYQSMFDHVFDDVELDQLLLGRRNAASRHYDRFLA